jgi:hypothetical protein
MLVLALLVTDMIFSSKPLLFPFQLDWNLISGLKMKGSLKDWEFGFSDIWELRNVYWVLNLFCFHFCRSLSRPDIQTVVESGCPNLLRKVVNSAKRMRAYVQKDEGDVCFFPFLISFMIC